MTNNTSFGYRLHSDKHLGILGVWDQASPSSFIFKHAIQLKLTLCSSKYIYLVSFHFEELQSLNAFLSVVNKRYA